VVRRDHRERAVEPCPRTPDGVVVFGERHRRADGARAAGRRLGDARPHRGVACHEHAARRAAVEHDVAGGVSREGERLGVPRAAGRQRARAERVGEAQAPAPGGRRALRVRGVGRVQVDRDPAPGARHVGERVGLRGHVPVREHERRGRVPRVGQRGEGGEQVGERRVHEHRPARVQQGVRIGGHAVRRRERLHVRQQDDVAGQAPRRRVGHGRDGRDGRCGHAAGAGGRRGPPGCGPQGTGGQAAGAPSCRPMPIDPPVHAWHA
jgi:hypothetical protein